MALCGKTGIKSMVDLTTIISSIGAAILSGGAISAVVSISKSKKENAKLGAERDNLVTQSVTHLLEPLNSRIEDLEKLVETLNICDDENKIKIQRLELRVKELQINNNQLINGINILVNQIEMKGDSPFWKPTMDLCVGVEE